MNYYFLEKPGNYNQATLWRTNYPDIFLSGSLGFIGVDLTYLLDVPYSMVAMLHPDITQCLWDSVLVGRGVVDDSIKTASTDAYSWFLGEEE